MRDHAGRIIKTKSWRRHHRGATMRGKPCRGIAEEKLWRRSHWTKLHGSEDMAEKSLRSHHGRDIMGEKSEGRSMGDRYGRKDHGG